MGKVSTKTGNSFCPQALFVYATNNEDRSPNCGLFSWFSYCWSGGELCAMACIGEPKRTLTNIRREQMFSANLVSEAMLPLADYFGNTSGLEPGKMNVDVRFARGEVLDVPVLEASPWSFELEIKDMRDMDEGALLICRIRNVLADERLLDEATPIAQRARIASPAISFGGMKYFGLGDYIDDWGAPKNQIKN